MKTETGGREAKMNLVILFSALLGIMVPAASAARPPVQQGLADADYWAQQLGTSVNIPADARRQVQAGNADDLRTAVNSGGPTVKGRMTGFGGSCDRGDNGHTASGVASGSVPGVAVRVGSRPNRKYLNGYWLVKFSRGEYVFKQIDVGPGSKKAVIDLSAAAIVKLGIGGACAVNSWSESNVTAIFLGRDSKWAACNGQPILNCRR
ncbi:MAG: hypothetical protein NTX64_09415 [Elusimicrobia bacterium]|nr:hypothetical protein [Elusimicrobiota bacterium]